MRERGRKGGRETDGVTERDGGQIEKETDWYRTRRGNGYKSMCVSIDTLAKCAGRNLTVLCDELHNNYQRVKEKTTNIAQKPA